MEWGGIDLVQRRRVLNRRGLQCFARINKRVPGARVDPGRAAMPSQSRLAARARTSTLRGALIGRHLCVWPLRFAAFIFAEKGSQVVCANVARKEPINPAALCLIM